MAICFVSVSALAGYEKASSGNSADDMVVSTLAKPLTAGEVSAPVAGTENDNEADAGKAKCFCKQKSDSQTLSCGVTLALSNDNPSGCLPAMKQAWFSNAQTDRNAQLMYLLKRPPRIILQS